MRQIFIIGIGVGDPDQVTIQALKALGATDVIFIPDKGAEKQDLRRLREEICARYATRPTVRRVAFETVRRRAETGDYAQDVAIWHREMAEQYRGLLQEHLRDGETGAFLVWGDPSLYDSTLRVMDAVKALGAPTFDYVVIPGITSVQALAASHRTALNRIGGSIEITTGRRLAEDYPPSADSVVVMLDGEQAFLRHTEKDLDIVWGAYLGSADEILVSGRLRDVADEIVRVRAEARDRKGWIMDTYLLRKRQDG